VSTQRDYYEILHISKDASLEDIRKAYREAALKYHPDRVPKEQKKEAEEQFKEISEAYAVLSDPQKRALYDARGHSGIDQSYTYEDIFKGADFRTVFRDLSDFGFGESLFDSIFGDFGFDLSGERRHAPKRRFHDLQISIEISLEEAATGTRKTVSFPRYDPCPDCQGRGEPCAKCHGEGKIRTLRNLSVTIPAGVATGSKLRIQGEGEGGQGDLYLVIEVLPHPLFRREGNNLILEKSISLQTAVLGGVVSVPTLFSQVKMEIPPGTQNGQSFRLKGKGMPELRGSRKGDEIVHITVAIPKHLSPEQKRLMEEFAKISEISA
jgi:molecular chaperone DnaJ